MKKQLTIIIIIGVLLTGIYLWVKQSREPVSVILNTSNTNESQVDVLKTYINETFKFKISYPSSFIVAEKFVNSYLLPTHWNVYAKDEKKGIPVVSFRIPNSDEILMGEVRIGVTADKDEIASCLLPPYPVPVKKIQVNGHDFSVFETSDAAMNHFSSVTGYRIIHENHCFAIDVLFYGSNGDVYDPPREPAFNRVSAEKKLEKIIQSFEFLSS